ncbi:MLO-like protein 10 [Vigna radiata var. radiata]|uniref:MLO-like protein n=1 Tax=Vigna radiata var. radiata TaxID=3916 RepID=A0A1S3UXG8_VIGRR|nr:MLO-like protein 10 [Vigna radiata var. radiata]
MSVSKYKILSLCLVSWLWCGYVAVASSESSIGSKDLDQTPTWAVACVCTVFILISLTLEKSLHKVGTWLHEKHKKALLEALEKVKAELMILGFLSLLLTFGQSYIVRICIPTDIADKLLPCPLAGTEEESSSEEEHRRKLLSYERRYLSGDATNYQCKKGQQPLISVNGLHQLHILIFFLAVLHVFYSAVTMLLGRLKIRGWKAWEEETSSHGYEFANDPSRFRLTHETSFVRAHASFWTRYSIFFYIGCFCRQFYRSVGKADYLALRNGFITVHLAPGSKFNFQKYIKRSLEDDFKVVVGVSPILWASFVVFLLLNVNGWHAMFWASLIPVVIILAVGTKLQVALAKMAIEITERHAVVQGIPLVQGSDRYFWFGRPQLVLHLIHFALFQNAFQITYFLWIWYSFGLKNCFHADYKLAIVKVALGLAALCLCSYITLPLYALVTQMGSRMKKSIFDEQTSKALKKWHMAVKKKQGVKLGNSKVRAMDGSTTDSTVHSSGPKLHRFKTTGHSTRTMSAYDDDHSDIELSPVSPTANLIVRVDHDEHEAEEAEHHPTANNQELSRLPTLERSMK